MTLCMLKRREDGKIVCISDKVGTVGGRIQSTTIEKIHIGHNFICGFSGHNCDFQRINFDEMVSQKFPKNLELHIVGFLQTCSFELYKEANEEDAIISYAYEDFVITGECSDFVLGYLSARKKYGEAQLACERNEEDIIIEDLTNALSERYPLIGKLYCEVLDITEITL